MDDGKNLRKTLALEPADAPTLGGNTLRSMDNESAADARARRDLHITTSDEFLAKAAKEYQAGTIDQALWRRAADKGGTDASLVIAAYLRSRALALQLQQKKDDSSAIQARGAAKARAPGDPKVESKPNEKIASTLFVGNPALRPKSKRWQIAGAIVALAIVAAIAFRFRSPEEIESTHAPMAAARAPADPSVLQSPPAAGQTVATSISADPGGTEPAFPVRIQQLKEIGKWNVLVLYATEWTRREPGNAIAWSELGNGFAKLRQYNDAIEAATKAVQLAPQDPFTWRNLGHINLAVDRVPEAGVAFAKALALRPDDADALCGAAAVALRQARPKDADGVTKQVKAADGTCPN